MGRHSTIIALHLRKRFGDFILLCRKKLIFLHECGKLSFGFIEHVLNLDFALEHLVFLGAHLKDSFPVGKLFELLFGRNNLSIHLLQLTEGCDVVFGSVHGRTAFLLDLLD